MNVQEFAGLKVGDIINNDMSNSRGEVVDVDNSGIRVRWYGVGSDKNSTPSWHYSVHSTAWFHWSKVGGEDVPQSSAASAADAPTS